MMAPSAQLLTVFEEMRERDFGSLLEALESAVNSENPSQDTISEIKQVLARAKAEVNITDELVAPRLSSQPPESHEAGFLDALREAALKLRGNYPLSIPSREASPAPVSPVTMVYPQGKRAAAFQRCYPFYAMSFQYATQKSGLFKRGTKQSFTTGFSPSASHFAICAPSGSYSIYRLPSLNLDDGPTLEFKGEVTPDVHFYLTLNTQWLVLASTAGTLYVISLESGEHLWTHPLNFGIRGLAISRTGAYIAVSINTLTPDGGHQPMVLLLCPDLCALGPLAFKHVVEITFIAPYPDPVHKLAFSPDELHIVCSTLHDSRFFIVSLTDPREPRLVVRSSRKVPKGDRQGYEGITSVSFFSRRQAIVVTSVAQGSPPIILDPRINAQSSLDSNVQSLSSSSSRSQSQILLRAEKVGSNIHQVAVSPHENSIAFLDKTGLVYVMFWPKGMDHSKKVSVVFELSSARSSDTSASLVYSEDGTVLYAVDNKGVLHIADFGAAMPSGAGVSRLRALS